jgi:hypothetical protein
MNYIMLNLGRMLFPNLPPDLRRRRMAVLFITALVSMAVAVSTAFLMIEMGKLGRL